MAKRKSVKGKGKFGDFFRKLTGRNGLASIHKNLHKGGDPRAHLPPSIQTRYTPPVINPFGSYKPPKYVAAKGKGGARKRR